MAIAATVRAAEIQADATFSATIYAAIIGAIGIGVGVIASWYTALHLQKVARLAETRRDVYLEFSESFSLLISEIGLIFVNLNENWSSLINSASLLNNKIDKVLFVCEVHNKESIYMFDKLVGEKIDDFMDVIEPLKDLATKRTKLLDELRIAVTQIDEIAVKIEKRDFENTEDSEQVAIDYFNELKLKIKNKELEINSIGEDLKKLMSTKSSYIKEIIKTLKEGFMPVSYNLRAELGAKTDIELDATTYSKFYK